MSSKNLKKLFLAHNSRPESSLPSPPLSPKQPSGLLPKYRSFKHGYEVIIFKGNHKGCIQTVRKYHPATARINTYTYELIPYSPSAPLFVGQQLTHVSGTCLPPATVEEINLLQVKHKNNVFYAPSHKIFQCIEINQNNKKMVQILGFGMDGALVRDINTDNVNLIIDSIKNDGSITFGQEMVIPHAAINPSRIHYILNDSIDRVEKGSVVQILAANPYAKIRIPYEFVIKKKLLKMEPDGTYTYQNHPAEIKETFEPSLELVINHIITFIPVSNVFYLDLLLKNGAYFSVNRINSDGTLVGREKGQHGKISTIRQSDIQRTLPGFTFLEDEYSPETDDVAQIGDEYIHEQQQDDRDQIGNVMDEVAQKYVLTFKNTEHMQTQKVKLTKLQTDIKNYINRLFNVYNINHYFDKHMLISDIEGQMQKIKQMLLDAGQIDFIGPESIIFLVACNVLRLIVKLDKMAIFGRTKDVVTTYMDFLIKNKFMERGHFTEDNIFTQGTWSKIVRPTTTPQTIMRNVWRLLNCFEAVDTPIPTYFYNNVACEGVEIKPLIRKQVIIKTVTAKQIFEDRIPSTATTVVWGLQYEEIINRYKAMLSHRVKTAKHQNTKIVYQYVLENFTRAPMALKELEGATSTDPLAQHKIERLNSVFEKLMNSVRVHETQREQKRKSMEVERQDAVHKRQFIDSHKQMKMMNLGGDNDWTPDMISPAVMEKKFLESVKQFKNVYAAVTKHKDSINYQTRVIKRIIGDGYEECEGDGDYAACYNDDE